MSSSSPVVTPGTTCGTSASRISAARRPAARMPGEALGPVQLDDAVAGLDPVVGGDGDIFGHRPPNKAVGRAVECRTGGVLGIGRERMTKDLDGGAGGDRRRDPVRPDPGQNVAQVATWLNLQGIRLAEVRIVPDDEERDRRGGQRAARRARLSVHHRRHRPDPRRHHGRLDRRGARRAGGRPSRRRAAILEDYYRDTGGLTEARLRMARVPEGAELIANPMSGAPGVRLGNIFILAGVPHIAASMLEALTGTLEGGRPMVSVTVGALGGGKRGRRPAARDRGGACRRGDRQLSVLQGRPVRRQFRHPLGGRASWRERCGDDLAAQARARPATSRSTAGSDRLPARSIAARLLHRSMAIRRAG